MPDDVDSPFPPLYAEVNRMRASNLSKAVEDVDSIINLLQKTRDHATGDANPQRALLAASNPIKGQLNNIINDIKEVTKAQRAFGKAVDKALPVRDLMMESDTMAGQQPLINRAIAMHFMREGKFSVASTFLRESKDAQPTAKEETAPRTAQGGQTDRDGDDDMGHEVEGLLDNVAMALDHPLDQEDLQERFADMFSIRAHLEARSLAPAITWARSKSQQLLEHGSTIEFDLERLHYIYLFLSSDRGPKQALAYARAHFGRFQSGHLREIQALATSLLYAPDVENSPYREHFKVEHAFEELATAFTRDYCSLLGLSADSPLYVAVKAGALALPKLVKYKTYMREKKTEWTSANELAFETPLPPSMVYHPIFVCPVSKEQTTEENPPMMLVCGHVLAKESLHRIVRLFRYKCPYCPTEGRMEDVVQMML